MIAGVDAGASAPPAPTNEAAEREAGPPDRRLQRAHLHEACSLARAQLTCTRRAHLHGYAEGDAPVAAPAAAPASVAADEEGGGEAVTSDEESGEEEVILPYRGGGAAPRPGASPQPVRYWFQPPGTSRRSARLLRLGRPQGPRGPSRPPPSSRRASASPAQEASPVSGSASGGD